MDPSISVVDSAVDVEDSVEDIEGRVADVEIIVVDILAYIEGRVVDVVARVSTCNKNVGSELCSSMPPISASTALALFLETDGPQQVYCL